MPERVGERRLKDFFPYSKNLLRKKSFHFEIYPEKKGSIEKPDANLDKEFTIFGGVAVAVVVVLVLVEFRFGRKLKVKTIDDDMHVQTKVILSFPIFGGVTGRKEGGGRWENVFGNRQMCLYANPV